MRPVLVICGTHLRLLMRDRANWFFVLVLPLLLVLVLGGQFGGENQGKVAVSASKGALRSGLVAALRADDIEVTVTDSDTVREKLARGRVDTGVIVSDEASKAFDEHRDAEITVIPGTHANAPAVQNRVNSALSRLTVRPAQVAALTSRGTDAKAAATALDRATDSTRGPRLQVIDTDEAEQEFAGLGQYDIAARGETLLFIFITALAGSSELIRLRRLGILSRSLSTPVSARQVLAGHSMGQFTVAAFQGSYIMILSSVLFGVDWGNPVSAAVVIGLFAAVAAGIGTLVGSLADNESLASGIGVGAGLVLGALGGGMMPLELFGSTMRSVANLTPHAWAYDALAQIQKHDAGLGDIVGQLGVLAAMALVLLALGTVALRRSTARGL